VIERLPGRPILLTEQKPQKLMVKLLTRPKDKELGRTKCHRKIEAVYYGDLAIFHTWRDFREQNILILETRLPLATLSVSFRF
jgi:hypothetical protein